MTHTYHARAFIALPQDLAEQVAIANFKQEVADLYLKFGLFGVTITEATGYTAQWGAETTLVVEAFAAVVGGPQDRFYAATRDALVALRQECALIHEETLIGRAGIAHAYAGLLNADGTRSELS